jgi:peroxiredoxin
LRPPPRSGDPAPEFELLTPWGVKVGLRECLLRHAALVEFIRGSWDPCSRERLLELTSSRERLEALGARALVVTCERASMARAYLELNPSSLTLLVDEAREASRAYGVFQRFSFGAFGVARPASFAVDRCGFVRYAHAGRSPIRAAPLEELLQALQAIEAEARR